MSSVFKDATSWPDTYKACGAPHQSPINLSRSFALPCDRLCELTIDNVNVSKVRVWNEQSAIKLAFDQGAKPSAKFNGEGYTATSAYLFNSGQHTIENVRAEAEFIVEFVNPKGYVLALSIPVRSSAGNTPSTDFFNKFVRYVTAEEHNSVTVPLGEDWKLQYAFPANTGYYVYEGSWILPLCQPDVTWVVFANAVTMDPSDFAHLIKAVPAGNRPLQEVADRQVFFNDGEKIEPGVPNDGKMYMKCRRVPRKGEISSSDAKAAIKQGNLLKAEQDATDKNRKIAMSNMETKLGDAYASLGGIWGVLSVLTFAGIAFYLFSEKGATLSSSLFGVLLFIPAYINRVTFALIWGQ